MDASPLLKSLKGGVPGVLHQPFDLSNIGHHPPTLFDDSPGPTAPSASDAPVQDDQSHNRVDELPPQKNGDSASPSDVSHDDLTTINKPSLSSNLLQLMKLVPTLSNLQLYSRMRRLAYPTYSSRNLVPPTASEVTYHDKSFVVEDMGEWVDIKSVSAD